MWEHLPKLNVCFDELSEIWPNVRERLTDGRALRVIGYGVIDIGSVSVVPGRGNAGWRATVLLRRGAWRTCVPKVGESIGLKRLVTGLLLPCKGAGYGGSVASGCWSTEGGYIGRECVSDCWTGGTLVLMELLGSVGSVARERCTKCLPSSLSRLFLSFSRLLR